MDELYALIEPALDNAIQSINGGTDPIIPFTLILQKDGQAGINRFMADDYQEAIELARNRVIRDKESIQGYVIVWSGFVFHEDEKTDAIIIEGSFVGYEESSQYYLAYSPPTDGAPLKELSNVKICERSDNLLA